MLTGNYYSGTSGLVLPVPNKTHYPPAFKDKSRLSYYGSLFNSIEVNSSFYKIPQASIIAKWAKDVPDDFRFTFKLWRGITHEKGLIFDPDDLIRFMQAISTAGTHKGCLLIQFPPGAKANLMPQLRQIIRHIQDAGPEKSWQVALEFRHPSWYTEQTMQLAEDHNLVIVLQDIPVSATPMAYAAISDTIYLRFHGPGGNYRGSYPDDVLMEYSDHVREWQEEGKKVYVYFNNTMGDAVQNLFKLNACVKKA